MDNRVDLPGYKRYLDLEGSRPDVCVAFLDLVDHDASAVVDGVCRPVDDDALTVLDRRERQYDRVDVTHRVTPASGRVWTYVGRTESRDRAAAARHDGRLVVARSYLEAVPDVVVDLPVVDLVRVEIP